MSGREESRRVGEVNETIHENDIRKPVSVYSD